MSCEEATAICALPHREDTPEAQPVREVQEHAVVVRAFIIWPFRKVVARKEAIEKQYAITLNFKMLCA